MPMWINLIWSSFSNLTFQQDVSYKIHTTIHLQVLKMDTYSEMWTKISLPPSDGVMKPWPLEREKHLHTPVNTGPSAALAVLHTHGQKDKVKGHNYYRTSLKESRMNKQQRGHRLWLKISQAVIRTLTKTQPSKYNIDWETNSKDG